MNSQNLLNRRFALQGMAFGAAAFSTPGLFADELVKTPKQTEGPFYPDNLPLDTDNDLLIINEKITPAVGEITHLTGKILDANGNPIRNAVVEIWQTDNKGSYLHSQGSPTGKRDSNFQGFGRFTTGSNGEYYFRTIKPVPYPGRTPHIHMAINVKHKRILSTQMYVKGHQQNARDGILNSIRDKKVRESVLVDFTKIKDSKIGELAANFNVVVGYTPAEK